MPGLLTEITEIVTALGTCADDLASALRRPPPALSKVPAPVLARLAAADEGGEHAAAFAAAFANGVAFRGAREGLRGRRPLLVEWKGPHRPPGDDVLPADLRIDHVYLVSCKYLSRVLVNSGPARLFDRLLAGERRSPDNWFAVTAPDAYRAFYTAARELVDTALPPDPAALSVAGQQALRAALAPRLLPAPLQEAWAELSAAVAAASAARWRAALDSPRAALQLLWRLLRVGQATYFVLGSDGAASLRLRVASTWDWHQRFDLRALEIAPRAAGQPEVGFSAAVRDRESAETRTVLGHVEIRWSHGRFVGTPEAKVYLDTPHAAVAGYEPLTPGPSRRAPAPAGMRLFDPAKGAPES
jgi:hypothetical protein